MKKVMIGVSAAFAISAVAYAQTNQKSVAGERTGAQAPARTAYIDPETGRLISKPADLVVPEVTETSEVSIDDVQSKSIKLNGVASKPQLMPNGSLKIDLNGQFMMPIRAEIDADGNIHADHHVENSSEEKEH